MIPYLPEGPPPLDEDEDVGSPVDTPVGFEAVLHGIAGAPVDVGFGDFATAFPTPQSANVEPFPAVESPDKDHATVEGGEVAPLESTSSDDLPKEAPTDPPNAGVTEETVLDQENAFDAAFDDFQSAQVVEKEVPPVEFEERDVFAECDDDVEKKVEVGEDGAESCQKQGEEDSDNHEERFEFPKESVVKTPDLDDHRAPDAPVSDEFADFASHAGFGALPDVGVNALTSIGNEVWEKEICEDRVAGDDDEFGDFGDFNSTMVESETFKETSEDSVEEKERFDLKLDLPPVENHIGDHNGDVDDGDDDFDGFREFESSNKKGDAADDDFGDFGDFSQTNFFQATDGHAAGDDDFGDFSQPDEWQTSSTPACPTFDEDVEFASFEKSNQMTVESSDSVNGKPAGLLEKILANMETVLTTCFENSDQITDESLALNALDTEGIKSEENDGIWTFLVDFDKAYALRYQLAKSLGNDCFLKSLNIDSRNVLKNPKKPMLPIFASQLGLLEPTRGSGEGGGKDNPLDSSVAPTTDSDSSIPAPEFDWNSSGLTNPLDNGAAFLQGTNSNFYLDLDFFEATQLKSSTATGHIKSELEEQFLCKELTNNNSPITNEVKFDPVQSILTQATRGASVPPNATLNCAELSTTAQAFVNGLPDLSYMKARVLMFPIGHS